MKNISLWILWILFLTSISIALTPIEKNYHVSMIYSALPNMTIDSCYVIENNNIEQTMTFDHELAVTLKMNATKGMRVICLQKDAHGIMITENVTLPI